MDKSWDNLAIDQTFDTLIDTTGIILDQYHLFQLKRIVKNFPTVSCFIDLLEYTEKEILVQWKIKQVHGLEKMFEHQRNWYHAEIRSQGSFFELWNAYVSAYSEISMQHTINQNNDPWKLLILLMISDKANIKKITSVSYEQSENLSKILKFFKDLFHFDPFHHVLGFLNIIELGLGFRPDILEPIIETGINDNLLPVSPEFEKLLKTLNNEDNWANIVKILQQFWLLESREKPDNVGNMIGNQ